MVEKPTKQPQKIRYNNEELQILKNTFAEKPELLLSLRKMFLQLPIEDKDKDEILGLLDENSIGVLKKMFNPELDGNMPLHQEIDLWLTLKLDDKDPVEAYPHILARSWVIEYLAERLEVLAGSEISEKKLIFADDDIEDTMAIYVKLLARNTVISHVEQQLAQIQMLAGTKKETPEETIKRLHEDSSK